MLRLILLCTLAAGLSGCTGFPQLDAAVGSEAKQAPYPKLAPLGQLVECPPQQTAPPADPAAALKARGAALRAKARTLYDTPVPAN